MKYFSGQGMIYAAQRDSSGNPLAFRYLGNAPDFRFGLEETVLEHKESYSGLRLTDLRLTQELKASVNMTLEQLNDDNLNLLLYGTTVTQSTSPVTGETLTGSTSPAVGNVFILASQNVAALVIKDSSGTPKTLTAGVNYSADLAAGQIEILDLTTGGPFTGPLKADYTRTATVKRSKMFGSAAVEYWLRFVGVNTAVSGSPKCIVDLYRARLSPVQEMGLITPELAQFALSGNLLADDTKTQTGDFGQFGRVILL